VPLSHQLSIDEDSVVMGPEAGEEQRPALLDTNQVRSEAEFPCPQQSERQVSPEIKNTLELNQAVSTS
jgi:hypothetical protein